VRGKIIRLPVCFAGSQPAMTKLVLAPPSIAIVSFDHRCTTPIPHVATGRPGSSLHRSPSKKTFNVPRQHSASIEIPIASDAKPPHTSRGSLPWRFAYAGPGVRRSTIMGPASANLHMSGHCEKLIRETAVSYLGGSPRSTERRRLPFESRLSSRRLAKSASPWGRTAPNYQQAITRADLCQTTSPRGRRTPC
jgi:hypothetical protein